MHSYIQILGTDANGAHGDINVVSTGRVLIQAPLQVSGSSTFGTTQAASMQVTGSSTLGTMASDTLTVKAVASFTGGSTLLYGGSGVTSTPAVLGFQRSLGTAAVSTGTVLGQVQYTGWDGAVYGLGAQIQSVFTVSFLTVSHQASILVSSMPLVSVTLQSYALYKQDSSLNGTL